MTSMFYKFHVLLIILGISAMLFKLSEGNSLESSSSNSWPESTASNTMIQAPTLIPKLLALSVSIAHKAGQLIREINESVDLHTIDKGINDFQTEADRTAQRSIVASFKNMYPSVHIVAEEVDKISQNLDVPKNWITTDLDPEVLKLKCPIALSTVTEDQVTIWIDPLDSTAEFAKGFINHVTILIGISVDGDAVAGVIYQPFWKSQGRAIWGLVGSGIGGLKVKEPPQNRTYITSFRHSNQATDQFLYGLQPCEIIKVGGAGNKVLYLLEGKAHAYVYPRSGCRRWHTAAPEAVLRAAGGELTDVRGNKYNYSRTNEDDYLDENGVIATAPNFDHKKFMELVYRIQSNQQ